MLAGRKSTDRKKSAGGPTLDSADASSSSMVGRRRLPSAPSCARAGTSTVGSWKGATPGCLLMPRNNQRWLQQRVTRLQQQVSTDRAVRIHTWLREIAATPAANTQLARR